MILTNNLIIIDRTGNLKWRQAARASRRSIRIAVAAHNASPPRTGHAPAPAGLALGRGDS